MFNYALIDLLFGLCKFICDAPPKSLKDPNVNMKVKTSKEGIGVRSLAHITSKVKKPCWNFGMRTKISDKWVNYLHGPTQIKQQVG